MIENFEILRQAGFFKKYSNLNEKEIFELILKKRKESYAELFGYEYEPFETMTLNGILTWDEKKYLDIDLEADVCADNKVYIWLLKAFANTSDGYFVPTDITEIWSSEQGPVSVEFTSNGNRIIFEPEYMDDWIDGKIFNVINYEMKMVCEDSFCLCSGPDDEWFGQNVIFIRLNQNEKLLLEEKLSWNFPEN